MTQALNLANFANTLNTAGQTSNSGLQNSSVTVTAGTGLSGGGAVALGGSISIANAGVTSVAAGSGISVSASTGGITITNTSPASAIKGLGYGGETWHDVTGSRAFFTTYTNTYSYPIMFAVTTTSSGNNGNHQLNMFVNGVQVASQVIFAGGNTGPGIGGIIVPSGATYSADNNGSNTTTNLSIWAELY